MRIPEKLKNMAPYDPTEGMPRVKLDANESFINLPDEMMRKVKSAIADVLFNRYPDPGTKELCDVAAEYFSVQPDQIVAGNGSDELISVIVNSFMEKGSKILVTKPDFSMYRFYAEVSEVEVVSVDKTDRTVDVEKVIAVAKEEDVSAVFFSNPCNPTGTGISAERVLYLAKQLSDILVVVDEAYMDFWDQSIVKYINELDNVIILRTCSKAFGLAGIRLGFAIAKKEITDLIRKAKSPFNINSITQAVARVVLGDKDYLESNIEQIIRSRESLQEKLMEIEKENGDKIKVRKSFANFVLVESAFSDEIFKRLSEKDIVIRKFPGTLRITAGSEEENEIFLTALKAIIQDC